MASTFKHPTSATKRLLHELRAYTSDPNPALTHLAPLDDNNLFTWTATLLGPPGTPYADVQFPLHITIPPNYPLAPPTLSFPAPQPGVPFPVHANIHPRTGEICLDLLREQWSPAYTLSSTCGAVQMLLASPEAGSPLDVDVAVLLREGDEVAVEGLVRLWGSGGGVG